MDKYLLSQFIKAIRFKLFVEIAINGYEAMLFFHVFFLSRKMSQYLVVVLLARTKRSLLLDLFFTLGAHILGVLRARILHAPHALAARGID